jgi:RNA polymerase sigma factor (TIGR02999 family)
MGDAPTNTRDDGTTSRETLDSLFTLAYEELRRLAAGVRRGDSHATISPTALVNEAWVKLAKSPPAVLESRAHFKRVAARAMRQVLVEGARRRQADKRGGDVAMVTFDESAGVPEATARDLVALDVALDGLAALSPRQAALVEHRFFGGLDVAETAAVLGISEATALRDWRAARAWLLQTLDGGR